jgi:hypothetical protein
VAHNLANRQCRRPLNKIVRCHVRSDDTKIDQPAVSPVPSYGEWLSVRRNFMWSQSLTFGGAVFVILFLGLRFGHGISSVKFWLYVAGVCLVGGYLWALGMWQWAGSWRKRWNIKRDT